MRSSEQAEKVMTTHDDSGDGDEDDAPMDTAPAETTMMMDANPEDALKSGKLTRPKYADCMHIFNMVSILTQLTDNLLTADQDTSKDKSEKALTTAEAAAVATDDEDALIGSNLNRFDLPSVTSKFLRG